MGQATTFLRTPERMMALIRSMVFTGAGAVGDGAVAVQAGGDEAIRQTGRLGVRTVDIAPVGLRLTGGAGGVGDDVVDGPVVEAETEGVGHVDIGIFGVFDDYGAFCPSYLAVVESVGDGRQLDIGQGAGGKADTGDGGVLDLVLVAAVSYHRRNFRRRSE